MTNLSEQDREAHRVHNHPPYRPNCRELFDEQGRLVGDCIRRENDPDREAMTSLLREHSLDFRDVDGHRDFFCICNDAATYVNSVDGHAYHVASVLAVDSVADIVRRARAEALREAARDLPGFDSIRTHGDAAKWLRDRAEAEQAPGDAQEATEATSSSLAGHGDADGGVRGGGA